MEIRVTGILCVYNEIGNIALIQNNILRNKFDELIIVDGGSTDGTYEFLSKIKSINLLVLKEKGLLAQRLFGIEAASNSYVFLFNADDDISILDFSSLGNEFNLLNADGLQIRTSSNVYNEFWSRAWSEYFSLIYPVHEKMNWLGRPCLTKKKYFEGISVDQNIFNEDTYLKYEQESRYGKLYYYASEQVVYREMPKGFSNNVKQFFRYGKSDVIVVKDSWYKFFDLLYHSFIRIFFLRSLRLILRGKLRYSLFTVVMGLCRGFAFIYYKIF